MVSQEEIGSARTARLGKKKEKKKKQLENCTSDLYVRLCLLEFAAQEELG